MLNWALSFLVVAVVGAALGLSGLAGAATNVAWALFAVGLVVSLIFFVSGRRRI